MFPATDPTVPVQYQEHYEPLDDVIREENIPTQKRTHYGRRLAAQQCSLAGWVARECWDGLWGLTPLAGGRGCTLLALPLLGSGVGALPMAHSHSHCRVSLLAGAPTRPWQCLGGGTRAATA